MPWDFGDANAETEACRSSGALFDYSFLIRVAVNGPDAARAIADFCGRGMSDLDEGGIRYALHADKEGHLLSDLTIWRTGPISFEVMTGCAADVPALRAVVGPYDAQVTDLSSDTACLAVQGPASDAMLATIQGGDGIGSIPYFHFRDVSLAGYGCRVGRLGFTGLRGIELLCSARVARRLWSVLIERFRPAGFLAADRLRLAAGLALFNQDFLPPVTAADAGFAHLRPLGDTAGDRQPATVVRVGFTANRTKTATDADLAPAIWAPGRPFPPKTGTIAVTSITPLADEKKVAGMGYVAVDEETSSPVDPTGTLKGIVISAEERA